jgi:hypothetical protein
MSLLPGFPSPQSQKSFFDLFLDQSKNTVRDGTLGYGTVRDSRVRYGALEISDNNGLPTVLNFLMNL